MPGSAGANGKEEPYAVTFLQKAKRCHPQAAVVETSQAAEESNRIGLLADVFLPNLDLNRHQVKSW